MARATWVEAAGSGIDWTFSPMVDVSRDQRWGRALGTHIEGPYLAASKRGCHLPEHLRNPDDGEWRQILERGPIASLTLAPELPGARELVEAFKQSTTSALARDILDRAMAAADADNCYQALKLVRRIMRHEDSVLGRPSVGLNAAAAAAQ